eukprot:TRINITY_DN9773_c0_g1_i1.p1 TRINITY_DN9773_c0_g1~~TRINITY_DN9773_c0_g1_i1.p1  ORF type:complete len:354 (-),score=61.80 TRINITY_DN9773_c0_g1_i1:162-1223(-)
MLDENAIIDFEEAWRISPGELKILNEIGRGAFGSVSKAEYLGITVAVKKIDKKSMLERDYEAELVFLKREIALMKACRHPNIVTFIGTVDKSQSDKDTQLVMEYMPKGDLRAYLSNPSNVLSWKTRTRMALDISCAMLYMHNRKIVFRDLKCQNFLVDEYLRVKLTDFGFARAKSSNKMQTMCGTEEFMAPEVLLGMDYGPSADIFSFGMVLFELITRKMIAIDIPRLPEDAFGLNEERIRESDLLPKDCPKELSDLGFLCCEYYPKDRPDFDRIVQVLKQTIQELDKKEKERTAKSPNTNTHTTTQFGPSVKKHNKMLSSPPPKANLVPLFGLKRPTGPSLPTKKSPYFPRK